MRLARSVLPFAVPLALVGITAAPNLALADEEPAAPAPGNLGGGTFMFESLGDFKIITLAPSLVHQVDQTTSLGVTVGISHYSLEDESTDGFWLDAGVGFHNATPTARVTGGVSARGALGENDFKSLGLAADLELQLPIGTGSNYVFVGGPGGGVVAATLEILAPDMQHTITFTHNSGDSSSISFLGADLVAGIGHAEGTNGGIEVGLPLVGFVAGEDDSETEAIGADYLGLTARAWGNSGKTKVGGNLSVFTDENGEGSAVVVLGLNLLTQL